jgi:hypothetical protein
MKVSIIGARRKRNGIGEYIGRYFRKNGATVTSVLGTTEETARDASSALRKYGIESTAYVDFHEMVRRENPDAIVIASPSSSHHEYLIKGIDCGCDIFCEKPFIWRETDTIRGAVENIFERAHQKNVTIAMNSQWPFSLTYYEEVCGKIDTKESSRFFISMSPLSLGKEMIPESVPHALSILYFVFGAGEIGGLDFEGPEDEMMVIRFRYASEANECEVTIRLMRQEEQPRDFSFGFNNRIVIRVLNLENYDIYFTYENQKIRVIDPLDLSVQDFMAAVREKREPLIGYSHIVSNTSLVRELYDAYPAM